jgi:hypothetical protein
MCRNTLRHELAMVYWLIFNEHSFRMHRHLSSILLNQYINLNNVLLRRNMTYQNYKKCVFKNCAPQNQVNLKQRIHNLKVLRHVTRVRLFLYSLHVWCGSLSVISYAHNPHVGTLQNISS